MSGGGEIQPIIGMAYTEAQKDLLKPSSPGLSTQDICTPWASESGEGETSVRSSRAGVGKGLAKPLSTPPSCAYPLSPALPPRRPEALCGDAREAADR